MGFLEDKRRARIFYKYFSKIYDYVNPIFYSKQMRRKVVELASIRRGDFVLEIGCGTGYTTEEITRIVGEENVVAIDLTPEQLKRAVEKLKCCFMLGDAENLPFKDNTFDATISAGIVEYLPNPQKSVEEMTRVTKSGGRVVILAPRKPNNPIISKIANSIMLFPSTQQCIAWFLRAKLEDIRYVEIGPYPFWSKLAVIVTGRVP